MIPLLMILGTATVVVAVFTLATIAWMTLFDYFEFLIPSDSSN